MTEALLQDAIPRTLVIAMPLPEPLLTINWRRQHPYWRQQARETRSQREAVAWATKLALPGGSGPVPYFTGRVRVDLTISPRPKQQRPDDTAIWEAAKPWLDGLETAWIVDDDKQFRIGALTWDKTQRTGELLITLTEVGATNPQH